MDKYCNSFSLLDPWENVDLSGSPLGCARRLLIVVACFQGAQCLVEDEHLRKCAILGGSTTVGTRANNGYEFHHSFSKLKNLTNKSFAKNRMRLNYVNKYQPQQYGLVYTKIWKESHRDLKAPKIMSSRKQLRVDQNQLIRMQHRNRLSSGNASR